MPHFATPIETVDGVLSGPFRQPKQMLQHQKVSASGSIHDDATAQRLGFQGGTIEGPTHFSQFEPLGERIWGERWFTHGRISAHFRAPAFENDALKAFARVFADDPASAEIWLTRQDDTEILRGTMSVDGSTRQTALEKRLSDLAPLRDPVICADLSPGMTLARVPVRMDVESRMGELYPFSLAEKLASATERATVHESFDTPWQQRVVPLEMISVLIQSARPSAYFTRRGPAVGLFADLEVGLVDGPVLADTDYEVSREIVMISGSRRTESLWMLSKLWDAQSDRLVAAMLLNEAVFKSSYDAYTVEYEALYGAPPPAAVQS